jgi:catechol 2,3-dioxygenase-like lactoylglutathione lyase family enzyme
MKRLHVHISVEDLRGSVAFYTTLFGSAPGVLKDDYAKWALDDPRVNFALSKRGRAPGLDHLGIQVDAPEELAAVAGRLAGAGMQVAEQHDVTCCYARSDKAWATDPQGIAWETFQSHAPAGAYGAESPTGSVACCGAAPCGSTGEAAAGAGSCCT